MRTRKINCRVAVDQKMAEAGMAGRVALAKGTLKGWRQVCVNLPYHKDKKTGEISYELRDLAFFIDAIDDAILKHFGYQAFA